jgi:hypothetical protein
MLELGLVEKRRQDRNAPIRGLCYVIAELADATCSFRKADGTPEFDWLTNPFMFQAFKQSIQKFMDSIAPPGEVRAPAEDEPGLANSTAWGPHDTPEARAEHVATMITHLLHRAPPVASAKPTPAQLWPGLQPEGHDRLGDFKVGERLEDSTLVVPEADAPRFSREMETELVRAQNHMSLAKDALLPKRG